MKSLIILTCLALLTGGARSAQPQTVQDTSTRLMLHVTEFAGPGQGATIDTLPTVVAPAGTPAGAGVAAYLIVSLVARSMNDSGRADALQFATEAKAVADKAAVADALEAAMTKRLDAGGLLRRTAVERVGDPALLEQPGLLVRVEEPLILTLSARYFFHPDLRSLHMLSTLRVWRKNGFAPIHQAELHYQSSETPDSAKDRSQKHWTVDDGKSLHEALAEAVEQTVALMAVDLAQWQAGTETAEPPLTATWINVYNGKKETGPLYVVGSAPGRWLARPRSKESTLLISLPQPAP